MGLRAFFAGMMMLVAAAPIARAQTIAPNTAPPAPRAAAQPQVVDLSRVNRRAWTGGNATSEIDVVQNRRYTNANRLELGGFFGFSAPDPFLSVKNAGGSIGYHFNTFYSLHFLYWKYLVSDSTAAESFARSNFGAKAATNPPKSFMAAQLNGNLIYGKLSVIGKVIIYFDLFVFGGAGIHSAQNGNSIAPFIGIGQRVHLDKHLGIRLDYRLMRYSENVVSLVDVSTGETQTVPRTTMQESVNLGLSYFF